MADFKSEWVAEFSSESMADFVGIRSQLEDQADQSGYQAPLTDKAGPWKEYEAHRQWRPFLG